MGAVPVLVRVMVLCGGGSEGDAAEVEGRGHGLEVGLDAGSGEYVADGQGRGGRADGKQPSDGRCGGGGEGDLLGTAGGGGEGVAFGGAVAGCGVRTDG